MTQLSSRHLARVDIRLGRLPVGPGRFLTLFARTFLHEEVSETQSFDAPFHGVARELGLLELLGRQGTGADETFVALQIAVQLLEGCLSFLELIEGGLDLFRAIAQRFLMPLLGGLAGV